MEYMFARWVDVVTVAELERLVRPGHVLTDEWTGPDEERYGAEFMFMLVTDAVPEEARAFVSDFAGRALLKFGHYGRYEANLAVVTPSDEGVTASHNTDSIVVFTLWSDGSPAAIGGLLDRLLGKPCR